MHNFAGCHSTDLGMFVVVDPLGTLSSGLGRKLEPAELRKHRLKCAVLPDRYAQNAAFARDARMAIRVSKDIQRLASAHTIEELAAMDWAEGPGTDGDDAPDAEAANDAAPAPAQVCLPAPAQVCLSSSRAESKSK